MRLASSRVFSNLAVRLILFYVAILSELLVGTTSPHCFVVVVFGAARENGRNNLEVMGE